MSELYLREDLAAAWSGADPFERVAHLEGTVYRAVANRRTLRFEAAGRAYFAKIHGGVGWREIFKNLLTLRTPVTGARNEYEACRHLERHGIAAPRVAGFGERGWNPAQRCSFVVCDALDDHESLEDLTAGWDRSPPDPLEKRRLLMAVARFVRRLHDAGVNHRDLYICHLLLDRRAYRDGTIALAVLDLHRAGVRRRVPRRWLRRDLAAILFSVLDLPLTRRDWLRFVRAYRGRPLRDVLAEERSLWRSVYRRAVRLYRKGARKGLVKGHFHVRAGRTVVAGERP